MLSFVDDCSVSRATGKVYCSDATRFRAHGKPVGDGSGALTYDLLAPSRLEGMEAARTGIVFEYDPETREARTIMKDLWFANGVHVTYDGSSVLVASTFDAQVRRYWISGPKAGVEEAFLSPLPGYVDNISAAPRVGQVWLAFGQPRLDFEKTLGLPLVRSMIHQLPEPLLPKAQAFGGAVLIDELTGEVLDTLWDPAGTSLHKVSHVLEKDGKLFFGSFSNTHVSAIEYAYAG